MKYIGTEKETFELQGDGYLYTVEALVDEYMVQAGTFSQGALDPDEYFGIYKYTLNEVEEECYCYNEHTDKESYVTVEDWMIEEIELELKERDR